VPRWLAAVFGASLLAWGGAVARERATPPVLQLRVHWLTLAEVPAAPSRPVLYFFGADWDENSVNQDDVFQDEELVEAVHRNVLPVRVRDRKHEDGANPAPVQALLDRYQVTGLPALVVQPAGEGQPRQLRGLQRADAVRVLVGE
jgi:thiol:disulfide interchange protein